MFQDRFKSEVIEQENYLIAAVRYIHNNPVKAGMVQNALQYPWSSYGAYINSTIKQEIIQKSTILGIFSLDEEKAVNNLRVQLAR